MEVVRPAQFERIIDQRDPTVSEDDELEVLVEESVTQPKCFDNLPRPDYSTFFGRELERDEILEHLKHPRAWITLVDGIGGVGKTALVLHCAESIRESARMGEIDFEYIIWASAKTEKLMPSGISQVQPTFSDLKSLLRTIFDFTGFGASEPEDGVGLGKRDTCYKQDSLNS